jgi:twitching motility protein PilT
MPQLSELPFADLAVEQSTAASRFKRFSGDLRLEPVPDAFWPELERIYAHMAQMSETRFRLHWPLQGASPLGVVAGTGDSPSAGLLMRGQRRDTPNGPVFILRRIAHVLLGIDQLGIPGGIIQKLRHPDLRAGLVLFVGGPGAGKTTAACALLMDRLQKIGGFTWTVENPVEYDLQGAHGMGQCYQEEVAEDHEIQRVLMDTLRSSADTLYIGEIREETSARAACLAAASGMLVISTLHADNALQALLKVGMLAGMDGLSQSLRAIITLRMEREMTAHGPQKVLKVQPFFVEDESTRQKIARNDMAALNMDLETQKNRFVMGGGR